jgi:hypothetical protein
MIEKVYKCTGCNEELCILRMQFNDYHKTFILPIICVVNNTQTPKWELVE